MRRSTFAYSNAKPMPAGWGLTTFRSQLLGGLPESKTPSWPAPTVPPMAILQVPEGGFDGIEYSLNRGVSWEGREKVQGPSFSITTYHNTRSSDDN